MRNLVVQGVLEVLLALDFAWDLIELKVYAVNERIDTMVKA